MLARNELGHRLAILIVLADARRAERMAVSFSGSEDLIPMLADELLGGLGPRAEFVSFGGECREALVFAGRKAGEGWGAVHVESGERLPRGPLPLTTDNPADYFFAADPAAVRAHSLGALCTRFDLVPLEGSNGYLTGDAPVISPWLRSYRVLYSGKADVKGFEAELAVRPVEGLSIDASLAYLHFAYKSISASAASSGIGLEDEGQFIIPWSWSIGAQYEADLGDAGTLTPRVDVSHDDSYSRNANNVDAVTGGIDIFGRIPGRILVNARLTYRTMDENWEVALEGRNLTDKLYYTDIFDNRGSTNSVQGSPGEPRTWAVSVKRKF